MITETSLSGFGAKQNILIVDDVRANLDILSEIIAERGYQPRPVLSGKIALMSAKADPPDLILLDINMPEMDGFEVCKRLKADAATKDIPVIFLTAFTETTHKVKAFSMGAVDYVTKPFQFEEIHARVETHLHLRKMQIILKRYNFHLEEMVNEKIREISESQQATIIAMSKLAESRDDDTGHHIERTRTFCKILAEKMRENLRYKGSIDDAFINNLFYASPLHDIGKVGISDNILLKPEKLTTEEFEIMKTHTIIGANNLQAVRNKYPNNAFINMGIAVARSHHEKWDGTGYPDGLAGEDVPLPARIMAVSDVYDALRSIRPYKSAFSHEKSCEIIMERAERDFDPGVVEAFAALEGKFSKIHEFP